MSLLRAAALVLAAYLVGAVSFSYLVVKMRLGQDVRTLGSGNAGATNVLRVLGVTPALAVLVFDIGKGVLVVAVARLLGAPGPVVALVAVAAVVGHVFPVYQRFRGGKGVATAAGALGSLAPLPASLAVAVFALAVIATRLVAIGSMLGVLAFPLFAALCGHWGWTAPAPAWTLSAGAAIGALVIVKHRVNIARIAAGAEWRLGDPRGPEEEP